MIRLGGVVLQLDTPNRNGARKESGGFKVLVGARKTRGARHVMKATKTLLSFKTGLKFQVLNELTQL